ncbi:hypothetical protein [Flavobacterium kingsejongi]|uniref:Uncharacterized protein n=1 Tax=Flavobacterium kingsejongi TaxID=1678728 RepID=A0A2S1LQA2_9FLAO|nr:hypothetical protein [Flavobacterium kingsejongi]AWG25826.1 hypothetical protein FK004_11640 [Flavobacterium kingsejongi]
MKRLRNIAIYYIVLGILCFCSFWLYGFWKLSIIGVVLLIVYFLLRFVFKIKNIAFNISKSKFIVWDCFLYLLPIIFITFSFWYLTKPFNQTIVLPKGYQGIITIEYDQKEGQPKKWIGESLGMGGSRLIRVDNNGRAKTQFKYEDKYIPLLGTYSQVSLKGMKIYYESNLNAEIPQYSYNDSAGTEDFQYEKLKQKNLPIAYTTAVNKQKNIIVVCKVKQYSTYFYTENEIKKMEEQGVFLDSWSNILRDHYYK